MSANNKPKRICLLNGPNLNLLGERNKELYGSDTLQTIETKLAAQATAAGYELKAFQSNVEGALIDAIHAARNEAAAIIINPGAYSHTSIAIRDALECFAGPIVEVHISNIYKREEFRRHSFVSEVASGVICGLGTAGYEVALRFVIEMLAKA